MKNKLTKRTLKYMGGMSTKDNSDVSSRYSEFVSKKSEILINKDVYLQLDKNYYEDGAEFLNQIGMEIPEEILESAKLAQKKYEDLINLLSKYEDLRRDDEYQDAITQSQNLKYITEDFAELFNMLKELRLSVNKYMVLVGRLSGVSGKGYW